MTAFIDPSTFNGTVYSGGWVAPSGGDTAIIEPATGHELGRTGLADESDVDKAAATAAAAQKEWAAATFQDRAAVLRKAGALMEQHFEEFVTWVVRECGTVRGTAEFFVGGLAAQECYEAAALASSTGSDLLVAQLGAPAARRAATDRIAEALPTELRASFVGGGRLMAGRPRTS